MEYKTYTYLVTMLLMYACSDHTEQTGTKKDSIRDNTTKKSAKVVPFPDTVRRKTDKETFESFLKSRDFVFVDTYDIQPGETRILDKQAIYFPNLRMGDNAKLVLADGIDTCTIIIRNGSFGQNCEISADGKDGIDAGVNPNDPWKIRGWWQAEAGDNGVKGVAGLPGVSGTNAKNINVQIGLSALGSLNIHANGGNGGQGGPGGQGQIGGNKGGGIPGVFRSCGYGGNGGDGGYGGDAGQAGNLKIRFWNENPLAVVQWQFLSASSKVGREGSSGVGGPLGPGGKGCSAGANGKPIRNGKSYSNKVPDFLALLKPPTSL